MSDLGVEVTEAEVLHHGFCQLERRCVCFTGHDRDTASYEYINKPSAVVVLPYDPVRDSVVLIKQFRVGGYLHDNGGGWLDELVAGIMNADEDNPEQTARRELQEEVGLVCQRLLPAGDFLVSPGFCTEKIYLYLAVVDATKVGERGGLATEHEYLTIRQIASQELFKMIEQNQLKSGPSLVMAQWFWLNYQRIRAEFCTAK